MSTAASPRDWDADTYERVASPQEDWAREVLARLPLAGDETVLDAGCGSGRVTRLLLERLPRGRVIGVDGSPSMVAAASEAFAGDPRVEVFVQDLLELSLDVEVDAVFSNATFHWITDHRTLFRRLHDALRPGGLLVAQCGGAGNIAGFLRTVEAVAGDERFGAYLRDVKDTWNFATPATTASLLRAAGFAEVRTWLEPREAKPGDPREFIRVACLGPHLERLPVELHDQFLDAVIAQSLSPLALDYVRLNIEARRPA